MIGKMKTLSIGITTFRNRFSDVSTQIKQIRTFDIKIPILLAITSNYKEKMPEDYRKGILKLCTEYEAIYPLMFLKYTGLSKMWNNLIIHCDSTHIFIMNDDITFNNSMALNNLRVEIQDKELFEVNWGFGTFVISKECADSIGYFDERFIAYGEEDFDFMKRYGKTIPKIQMPGLLNRIQNRNENSHDNGMDCVIADGGFKPKINVLVKNLKDKEKWVNEKQYPYEKFLSNNFDKIGKL
jgi:hypothetical protein